MAISNIRVTARTLQRCVHEAAKSSSNVVFIPEPDKGSMAGMMTFQQAMSCLRSGNVVGTPRINQHGHWEFQMQRFAANHLFSLRAIAECEGVRVSRLFAFLMADSP